MSTALRCKRCNRIFHHNYSGLSRRRWPEAERQTTINACNAVHRRNQSTSAPVVEGASRQNKTDSPVAPVIGRIRGGARRLVCNQFKGLFHLHGDTTEPSKCVPPETGMALPLTPATRRPEGTLR